MEKIDIVRNRILEVMKDIKEDKTRSELSVLFAEYDTAMRKTIKNASRVIGHDYVKVAKEA